MDKVQQAFERYFKKTVNNLFSEDCPFLLKDERSYRNRTVQHEYEAFQAGIAYAQKGSKK